MNRCIIPARAGSERLKNKNLKKIEGKTLIEIALESALKSGVCGEIIISTDIERRNLPKGRSYIYDIRPPELSSNRTSTDDVVSYLTDKYDMANSDSITILQPTSPLRSFEHVKGAFEIFKKKNSPVISVYRKYGFPQTLFYRDGSGYLKSSLEETKREYFIQNGAIYIFKVKDFRKEGIIPSRKLVPFIMKEIDSADIDTYLDYITASLIYTL